MTAISIKLTDLTKKYGSYTAVDHLNLSISKGEVFGLLGPNGAGKSTTILMILGLTEPDSGSVKVHGVDSTSNPVEVKKKVGYLPEDIGFYDDRSGLENLVYTGRLNGLSYKQAAERAGQLLRRVGLSSEAGKKTGKYSRGMRQRLGLADVLIKEPEVIILDEPTLGIDPSGVREFLELIVKLSREEGLTVLFSSHHLYQVQQVCDRVGLFVNGKLLAEGDINALSKKLFENNPYTVEIGVSASESGKADSISWLRKVLEDTDGVLDVNESNGIYRVECSRDVTSAVARAIVGSGADLYYLNRKEYGLDDIYHKYFEGGTFHE